jgi:hypothetical protein
MDWDTDLSGVMGFIEAETKELTYETANKVWNEVMKLSPVYTGRYRASWTMSADQPKYNAVIRGGSPEAPLEMPKKPFLRSADKLPTIFIVNASPYAERIEYGWSKQAPYGVIINAMAVV